jgi:hypothetical protein
MARIVKSKRMYHLITVSDDRMSGGQAIVVGKGRRAYLWVGGKNFVWTFTGTQTLRRLALAILDATGGRTP